MWFILSFLGGQDATVVPFENLFQVRHARIADFGVVSCENTFKLVSAPFPKMLVY